MRHPGGSGLRFEIAVGHHRQHEKKQQRRRSRRPSASRARMRTHRDHAADHRIGCAADETWNDEFARGWNENQKSAGDNAGNGKRQGHIPEDLPRTRAQIHRRFIERLIEFLQICIERQDHEGQVGIDHHQDDGEIGVHHRNEFQIPTPLGESIDEKRQAFVEPAIAAQQSHPGIDAQEKRRPERQDHQHQHDVAPGLAGARDAERHGIAEKQAENGRRCRIGDRSQEGADVNGIVEEAREIVEAQIRPCGVEGEGRRGAGAHCQAHGDDDDEGQEEEEAQPNERDVDDETAPSRLIEPGPKALRADPSPRHAPSRTDGRSSHDPVMILVQARVRAAS